MNYAHIEECLMVDTLGLCVHDADTSKLEKQFKQVDGGEASEWSKGAISTAAGKQALKVRGIKSKRQLRIETSPAFLRQVHNVISSGDVTMLAFAGMQSANRELDLGLPLKRGAEFAHGRGIEVTRVDTPVLLAKPPGLSTAAVLNAVALAGLMAGNNISVYANETVYFDQHSQQAAIKLYDKAAEMASKRKLKVPATANTAELLQLAQDTIRLEAVYRQKMLKVLFSDHAQLTPALLTKSTLAHMLVDLLAKYDLKRDIRRPLNQEQLIAIPRRFRPWVTYWQAGQDALRLMDNNVTEYSRAHGYLELKHGINIYAPPPVEIEDRIELGDILHPSNFVPVPAALKKDSTLFFELDMDVVREELNHRAALEG